jgi:hypothetical protein
MTLEWFFSRVDSKVVLEIMPFPKEFCPAVCLLSASRVVAFEDFHHSLGAGVLKGEHAERSCRSGGNLISIGAPDLHFQVEG